MAETGPDAVDGGDEVITVLVLSALLGKERQLRRWEDQAATCQPQVPDADPTGPGPR